MSDADLRLLFTGTAQNVLDLVPDQEFNKILSELGELSANAPGDGEEGVLIVKVTSGNWVLEWERRGSDLFVLCISGGPL